MNDGSMKSHVVPRRYYDEHKPVNTDDSKPPIRSLRILAAKKLRDPIMRKLALASKIDTDAIIKRAEVITGNVKVSGRVSDNVIKFDFTYAEDGILSIKSLDDSKFWFDLNTEHLGDSKGFMCSHEKPPHLPSYHKTLPQPPPHPSAPPCWFIPCVSCLIYSGYESADLNDMTKIKLKSLEEDEKKGLCHLLRDGDCTLIIVSSFEEGRTSYRIDCLQHLNVWLEIIVIE